MTKEVAVEILRLESARLDKSRAGQDRVYARELLNKLILEELRREFVVNAKVVLSEAGLPT